MAQLLDGGTAAEDLSYEPPDQLLAFRAAILDLVRDIDRRDPTLRQLAVMLVTLTSDEPETVKSLATQLNVAKPAVTRAADALEDNRFAKRVPDHRDRRSVIIRATPQGAHIVRRIATAFGASLTEGKAATDHRL